MPYQVYFEQADGKTSQSEIFARFYEAQTFAMKTQKALRANLVAIREVEAQVDPAAIQVADAAANQTPDGPSSS